MCVCVCVFVVVVCEIKDECEFECVACLLVWSEAPSAWQSNCVSRVIGLIHFSGGGTINYLSLSPQRIDKESLNGGKSRVESSRVESAAASSEWQQNRKSSRRPAWAAAQQRRAADARCASQRALAICAAAASQLQPKLLQESASQRRLSIANIATTTSSLTVNDGRGAR